jgi:hypothetical protein
MIGLRSCAVRQSVRQPLRSRRADNRGPGPTEKFLPFPYIFSVAASLQLLSRLFWEAVRGAPRAQDHMVRHRQIRSSFPGVDVPGGSGIQAWRLVSRAA